MAVVVLESSMSMRTNLPFSAAALTSARTLSAQRAGSTASPSPVSFTLTLASRPSRSIAAIACSYSPRMARASSLLATSSPRTSSVASFPAALSLRTTAMASSSSGPAM